MKKMISLLLALAMCLCLCACGANGSADANVNGHNGEANKPDAGKPFPYVGTWANQEGTVYLRIEEGGKITCESIMTNTSTSTVNGVSTSSTSKTLITNTYTWSMNGDQFMFNGIAPYEAVENNGTYSLVGEKITYYRVGELDYEISMEDENAGDTKDLSADSVKYTLGQVIKAEGFELVLDEVGIAKDIRISSNSSGIKITSGPSVEDGKQYVYLRGTLKNTGTAATRSAIGGVVYLDEYEFNLRTDTIATSGAPKSSIDPLDTVHILLYAQITDEMASIFSEGKIIFGFNDNFSNVQIDQAQYLYFVEVKK